MSMFEKKFRTLTDRFFFKKQYVFSEVIHELSTILGRHNRIEEIIKHASPTLQSALRAEQIIFALVPEYAQIISEIIFGLSTLLPTTLAETDYIELTEHSTSEFFPLALPLIVEEKCIGIIFIGPKRSGENYTTEDRRLLQTFCQQVGVAFRKAFLYQQVLDYSQNLSHKVAERTAEIKSLQENQTQLMLEISHELQTPLTILKGELELLRGQLPNSHTVNTFEKTVDRVSGFIQALLKLAKLEAAETTVKTRLNFSALVTEVVEYVTVLASAKNIAIHSQVTKNLFVRGNLEQLEQLLTNLLSNALKYIANERVVQVLVRASGKQVRLEIIDTGIGIAKDQLNRVFERFYRIQSNPKAQGTGLGLAICEKIVKKHGGVIMIDSKTGQGTQVSVILGRTK